MPQACVTPRMLRLGCASRARAAHLRADAGAAVPRVAVVGILQLLPLLFVDRLLPPTLIARRCSSRCPYTLPFFHRCTCRCSHFTSSSCRCTSCFTCCCCCCLLRCLTLCRCLRLRLPLPTALLPRRCRVSPPALTLAIASSFAAHSAPCCAHMTSAAAFRAPSLAASAAPCAARLAAHPAILIGNCDAQSNILCAALLTCVAICIAVACCSICPFFLAFRLLFFFLFFLLLLSAASWYALSSCSLRLTSC